jgi:hypothetical protein
MHLLGQVTQPGRPVSDLGVMSVLHGFLEGRRSEVMFLPRSGYSVVVGSSRSYPDVLVRFGEGCRLHRVGVYSMWTCSVWWWQLRRG